MEVAGFTSQAFRPRIGYFLNIQMTATFHQFGSHDAHGAVVGRKRLIQLRHSTADG
jgi:hypothetical protein